MTQQDPLEAALRLERAEASLQRGRGAALRGDWQQASRALTTALEENPELVEAQLELARCHAQLGEGRTAERLLVQALERPDLQDFDRIALLNLLGRVCIQGADYAQAAEAFQTIVDISGTGGAALNKLAAVFCKAGQFERGFELFLSASRR